MMNMKLIKKKGLSLEEIEKIGIYYFVYDTEWYEYEINDKTTLCDNKNNIIIDNVDDCNVWENYYEYEINDIWYKKNFDGSDYKKENNEETN